MKRTLIEKIPIALPEHILRFTEGARIYDSSCSPEARVYLIDKDGGYFLKSSDAGTLKKEAELSRFFCQKGIGPHVEAYLSGEKDWLLTRRVPGEDCTDAMYLNEPKRLCDTLAEILVNLHATSAEGCPVPNRTAEYLAYAETQYRAGEFDPSYLPARMQGMTADDAWKMVAQGKSLLRADTLLHGDYCLPNVMLDNWKFSGFIDVCHGGVGDRHIDIYWAVWSLAFNIKSEPLTERFLDAYGREKINMDALDVIAAAETFG